MICVGIPNGSKFRNLLEPFPSMAIFYNRPGQTEGESRERAA
jgi:hypothetical protein